MAEFRQLADGVYAYLQPPLVWHSNAGAIVGEREVIVVDSLTNAAMAQDFLAEIRRVTDKPVRFLINTHSHPDHVFTNHLFPEAVTISTRRGWERTKANQGDQAKHAALFGRSFPDVDFAGGRYTPQDIAFSGTLSLQQGGRELRVLELGPGHSESDAVVYLPAERIVFCGDVFLNGMAPLPAEGHVSETIANCRALEALPADVFIPGHGAPGTVADVRAQRIELESRFQHARACFGQGMTYDEALAALTLEGGPLDSGRVILLASYCEFAGRPPETTDRASQNHLTLLQAVAAEARQRLAANQEVGLVNESSPRRTPAFAADPDGTL